MRVTKIWIHPVKSCRAIAVESADVDELGLAGDRRFLVTDSHGQALTQRSHPALARVSTALDHEALTLSSEGHGSIRVARQEPGAPLATVDVWNDRGLRAEHCGPSAAAWLSELLGTRAQLVRIGAAFRRPVKHTAGDTVNFADAYPLLVLSEASLLALNDRLTAAGGEPVPMDRFRPNLVIDGVSAHAEDEWSRIRIGDAVFRGATLCARCIMITTDQQTGARTSEPLRTLASYRRDPARPRDVVFGRNMVNETKRGRIALGPAVALD